MKSTLRKKMLLERKSLKFGFKTKADLQINEALNELPQVQAANKVLAFAPLKDEPNILAFLESVLEEGKKLYLPRVNNENLDLVKIESLDDLEEGTFGVLEPMRDLSPDTRKSFDLILVPGVAFSEKGDRLGFGKGFYDKLLKRIFGYTIGIAYDFQVLDGIPTEDHDENLDMVLSEAGVYFS